MTRLASSRRSSLVLVALLAVGVVGFLWYAQPQPLLPEATAALASTAAATFAEGPDGRLTYTPTAAEPTTGLILYPGGKVPPAAYAPAARAIAEQRLPRRRSCRCPFNLAVFGIDAASARHRRPSGDRRTGPSAATRSAARWPRSSSTSHPGTVDGLVLWASYSAADLVGAAACRSRPIYGSLDNGVPSFTSAANVAKLGPDVTSTVIEGGNHEQMGWYTGQPNDPPATISREDQQAQVVEATTRLLAALAAVAAAQPRPGGRRGPARRSRTRATTPVATASPTTTSATPASWPPTAPRRAGRSPGGPS